MRKLTGIAGVLAIAFTLVLWRCWSSNDRDDAASSEARRTIDVPKRVDPRTLPRASIAGKVTDEHGAGIAQARVCGRGGASPICTSTDAGGAYTLAGLVTGSYTVGAAANAFAPALWGGLGAHELALGAGEQRAGIDIALQRGGAELAGTVSDVLAGRISHARVVVEMSSLGGRDRPIAEGETDAEGHFKLWVATGKNRIVASADGYVPRAVIVAPPAVIDVQLTPASSIAGSVVDAAGHPVAGARVVARSVSPSLAGRKPVGDVAETESDDSGRFLIDSLAPGRYALEARAAHAFATSSGSVLVGLAEHVDAIALRLAPAFAVVGRVVAAETKVDCPRAAIALEHQRTHRSVRGEPASDARVVVDSLLPGTYLVTATCPGHAGRIAYPPITITDRDVGDQVWEVDAAATLRGRVVSTSGVLRTTGSVLAFRVGAQPGDYQRHVARIAPDGRFVVPDLAEGAYDVAATLDESRLPDGLSNGMGLPSGDYIRIDVPPGVTVDRDVPVSDLGTVVGVIVDSDGAPLPNVPLGMVYTTTYSDAEGHFRFDAPPIATPFSFTCNRDPQNQFSLTDTLLPIVNQTIEIKIVRCAAPNTIRGTVVDERGRGIADVYVDGTTYVDGEPPRDHRAVTASDGSFTLTGLPNGGYSLRAYRRGGGEAFASNVAPGSTTTLVMHTLATLEGVARRQGKPAVDVEVEIGVRREQFVATGGAFAVHDLEAGTTDAVVRADGQRTTIRVALAAGETRTVDVDIGDSVTLTGRTVLLGTTTPVSDVRVSIESGDGLAGTTDEHGRFEIADAPTGYLTIRGWGPKQRWFALRTQLRGTGTVDLGDIALVRPPSCCRQGDVGFQRQRPPGPYAGISDEQVEVTAIDPAGPAARSGLRVGDVITSVDGYDVRGERAYLASLLEGDPGAAVTIGVARGAFFTITRTERPQR